MPFRSPESEDHGLVLPADPLARFEQLLTALDAGFTVCGDFEQGFVRTACRKCGDELRVPFS